MVKKEKEKKTTISLPSSLTVMAPQTTLSIARSSERDFSEISSPLASNFKIFPFTDGFHQSGRKRGVFP
ncbi:hypothetical protein PJP07_30210, partial [Mycobacterium kansasii]